ncbi:MAG: hypothetical protein MUP68_07640, partial [Deltaproteobacteria bacterium]|nr:hypothetical protein [Deltaproteobacteria bacterium]
HPPVRAGQSLPGPGGEMLRWAKRRWFFHDLELYFHRCNKDICFLCSLSAEAKCRGAERFAPTVWPARSISPPGLDNHSEIMRENKK